MVIQNKKRDRIAFCIGMLLFLLVLAAILLWIYIVTSRDGSFEAYKTQYLSFFPTVLRNAFLLTLINIIVLGIAIYCFILSMKAFKYTALILAILAGILLMWQIFSLM